jgi:hypothetical protein
MRPAASISSARFGQDDVVVSHGAVQSRISD